MNSLPCQQKIKKYMGQEHQFFLKNLTLKLSLLTFYLNTCVDTPISIQINLASVEICPKLQKNDETHGMKASDKRKI